jgi:predicted glycosyltransferase
MLNQPVAEGRKKIWIDLDNSPHVPLFKPIIDELNRRGYECVITSRDCFQVAGLVKLHGVKCKTVGKHYGKNSLMKLFGLMYRGLQLMPYAIKEKPRLALSHGSRSQHLAALLLGIPTIIMLDYEYVKLLPFAGSTWIMTPEYISTRAIKIGPSFLSTYPGLKEDVYVPHFVPDTAAITKDLGLNVDHLIVTVRPPATEAHYHNPESEKLFFEILNYFGPMEKVTMILLPRNDKQAAMIRNQWPDLISERKIIIPDHVVDGLNLMWHSDLVISGGGTMNREAAALRVPVYSIFRGTIGAVDRYLASQDRLILLESPADVRSKIRLQRRDRTGSIVSNGNIVLHRIVDEVVRIVENGSVRGLGREQPSPLKGQTNLVPPFQGTNPERKRL